MLELSQYSSAARILALKMTGQVGPRTFLMLMEHLKTVENILLAEVEELYSLPGIGEGRAKAIYKADTHLDSAQQTIDNLEAVDTQVVSSLEEAYPSILHELNDPPMLLYFQGKLPLDDEKRVAIIGSQDVSAEGIGDVVELAKKLAEDNVSIVSGLARGIDTAGHMGALKAEGRTYAMLPSGFNHIYPTENAGLAKEITSSGCLFSEYLPDTKVNAGQLVNRNRLIVGLSQAIIIGEVSENSVGTMDAALCCHQLGKLMFVIIGGSNPHYEKLAEYGAIPLTNIEDYKLVLKSLV
ncbi:MAG: hypothetical protein GY841_00310 [FCB group bacterium]|nr:hypothetical protein [FCB group bacterium]